MLATRSKSTSTYLFRHEVPTWSVNWCTSTSSYKERTCRWLTFSVYKYFVRSFRHTRTRTERAWNVSVARSTKTSCRRHSGRQVRGLVTATSDRSEHMNLAGCVPWTSPAHPLRLHLPSTVSAPLPARLVRLCYLLTTTNRRTLTRVSKRSQTSVLLNIKTQYFCRFSINIYLFIYYYV